MRNDRSYFLARAETQMELALRANCEDAARAHYHLAGFYWNRAFGGAEARDAASVPQRSSHA